MKIDSFFPYRLARIADAFSLEIQRVYKNMYGINRPEWRVLASLADIGPTTATHICKHSTQHKTKVSRAVYALEQRRWLKRETLPEDRRNELLSLTKAGQAAYAELVGPILQAEDQILSRLSSQERETLDRAITALERALELSYGGASKRVESGGASKRV